MRIAETFVCKIVDEYGGVYPEAVVSILDGYEYSNRGFSAEAPGSAFVFKTATDGLSYEVMYWYDKDKVGKFKSHPLRIPEGNGFTDVIRVNMDDAEIMEIMEKSINQDDKIMQAVKSSLIRYF
tara:strand:- start:71 stop:442 length:372 start_codon:yes stop_codon:yes gene_type:complete